MPFSDLVIIIIVILGVSAIIGFNIVNLVDKKLSYITINIPAIEVPEPQIQIVKGQIEGFDNLPEKSNTPADEKIRYRDEKPDDTMSDTEDCISDETDDTESYCKSCESGNCCDDSGCDCHKRPVEDHNVAKWERGNRPSCCKIMGANVEQHQNAMPADRTDFKILYKKRKIKVPFSYNATIE